MADAAETDTSPLQTLKSYFFQNNMNDPRVNSQLRNQMAVAMLSQKKGYPKTVGEGLTAIGDALGDRAVMNSLAQADIAKQAQGTSAVPDIVPQAAAPQASSALPPSVANANASVVPDQQPDVPQPPPGPGMTAFDPNAARNRISTMLAGGGPQPNPTVGGSTEPQASVASVTPTPTVLSDVSKAPDIALRPGTQLAQAAPAPSYVMQAPVEPKPPVQIPMGKRELDAITAAQNYPNNEYVQQRAAAVIAQEKAIRDFQALQNEKLFQSRLDDYRALKQKYEEQRASAVQRGLTEAKTRQEIEQGNRPKLEEDVQSKFYWDPVAGAYRVPSVVGQDPNAMPQPKLSEYQGNSVKFANQMYDASHDIDPMTLTSRKDAIASSIPLIHSWAEGNAYKGAQGAAVRWIMGKLRSESGATINPDEFAREYKSFIPVAGDTPEVVAQKAQARRTAEESMAGASGPGRMLIDYHTQQDAKGQQRMSDEMGEMAKKTGKPIVPGKVYINPDQPGKSRIFINGRWREY